MVVIEVVNARQKWTRKVLVVNHQEAIDYLMDGASRLGWPYQLAARSALTASYKFRTIAALPE